MRFLHSIQYCARLPHLYFAVYKYLVLKSRVRTWRLSQTHCAEAYDTEARTSKRIDRNREQIRFVHPATRSDQYTSSRLRNRTEPNRRKNTGIGVHMNVNRRFQFDG